MLLLKGRVMHDHTVFYRETNPGPALLLTSSWQISEQQVRPQLLQRFKIPQVPAHELGCVWQGWGMACSGKYKTWDWVDNQGVDQPWSAVNHRQSLLECFFPLPSVNQRKHSRCRHHEPQPGEDLFLPPSLWGQQQLVLPGQGVQPIPHQERRPSWLCRLLLQTRGQQHACGVTGTKARLSFTQDWHVWSRVSSVRCNA